MAAKKHLIKWIFVCADDERVVEMGSWIWQHCRKACESKRRGGEQMHEVNRCMRGDGKHLQHNSLFLFLYTCITIINNNKRLIRQRLQSESALCWLCRRLFLFFFLCARIGCSHLCTHTRYGNEMQKSHLFWLRLRRFRRFRILIHIHIHHHCHHHLLCIVHTLYCILISCVFVCEVECRHIHISDGINWTPSGERVLCVLLYTKIKLSHSLFTVRDGDSTSTRFEAVFISKQTIFEKWNMRRSPAKNQPWGAPTTRNNNKENEGKNNKIINLIVSQLFVVW